MSSWINIALACALVAGSDAALAGKGGGRSGGHGGGGHFSGGFGHFSGVRPGFAHRPFFHHGGRVVVGSAIFIGAVGYPYYAYPYDPYYYPPAYAEPGYVEPPANYIEQSAPAEQVLYYCPDSRAYYPNVTTCPSPWLKVVP
jgi:hypothetical protein